MRKPEERLVALLHHITTDVLAEAFHSLKRDAAAGVTWDMYAEGLEGRLIDLHGRVHRGAYRAPPVRRVEIPKPDGGKRPLGIAALEDKIIQKAVTDTILVPIYETEFLGFSYGFRPGRSQHNALDAVTVGIERQKVSWILDADIKSYFDTIDRDQLLRFLEHRIGDDRVLRLISKWLNAGVMEGTDWTDSGKGTPQGGEHQNPWGILCGPSSRVGIQDLPLHQITTPGTANGGIIPHGFWYSRLERALAAVRKGDILVVTKLGHLARSVPDVRAISDQLEAKGIRLALGPAIYDPTNLMGKMFFNIVATFAEFEVDLLKMRTREGMAIAKAKGKMRGKKPKLTEKQQNELLKMYEAGEHSIRDLAETFSVSRATVYRTVQRDQRA